MKPVYIEHAQLIETALRTATYPSPAVAPAGRPPSFVTICRQAGAGGKALAAALAVELNRVDPGPRPWTAWDHELVEKVAAEHHIPEDLVEALEDADHPWFREFVESLSSAGHHSDFKVYRRVALTIRALANAGRAVIVGRGGVFVTAGMAGGVHVRLVAPAADRVRRTAERHGIAQAEAADRVRAVDRNRAAFYRRYWPDKEAAAETFTATLNTAELTDRQMVACLVPLVVNDAAENGRPADKCRGRCHISPLARWSGTVRGGAV